MPKSRGRKKAVSTTPQSVTSVAAKPGPSPTWWAPVMVALMLIGLLWVVTFYITNESYPVPQLGRWNIGVGFGAMLAGFMMTTRWR